jgi:hypothetical protein
MFLSSLETVIHGEGLADRAGDGRRNSWDGVNLYKQDGSHVVVSFTFLCAVDDAMRDLPPRNREELTMRSFLFCGFGRARFCVLLHAWQSTPSTYNVTNSISSRRPQFPHGDKLAGFCPYTHPIHMPGVMLEFGWFFGDFAKGQKVKGHLIWASGDTTGCGVHGDFTNG